MIMQKKGWLCVVLMVAMLNCTVGVVHRVGGKLGWATGVNYTEWAANEHFYVGEWLLFFYDKHQFNVFEVNKTNYEQCHDQDFIKNITRGGGKDVYNLTQPGDFYFLSSGGYCYGGMKVAIHVVETPLPAPPPSVENNSRRLFVNYIMMVISVVISIVYFRASS